MEKVIIDTDACLQCGSCEGCCPQEAISPDGDGGVYEVDVNKCTYPSCETQECFDICPVQAIIKDSK